MSNLRSVIGKSILFIAILVLSMSLVPVNKVVAGPEKPKIDIYTDVNGDQIPDALLSSFQSIAQAKGADKQAAITAFVNNLPYSAQTRKLQQQAHLLQTQIGKTKNPAVAQSLLKKISALQKQMMADPAYAQTMSALGKVYVRSGKMPAAFAGTAPDVSADSPNMSASVNVAALSRGDIMLIRSGLIPWTAFIYAMWYSHAGTYDGNQFVYDSNSDGVKLNSISSWKQSGNYLAFGYNKNQRPSMSSALTWAENKYGTSGQTSYNYWFPDKWTDSQLYCSQLVWKINQHVGSDVDSNAWQYALWIGVKWGAWAVPAVSIPAVAPDELYYASPLYFYTEGWY